MVLTSTNVSRYAQKFIDEGWDSLEAVAAMSEVNKPVLRVCCGCALLLPVMCCPFVQGLRRAHQQPALVFPDFHACPGGYVAHGCEARACTKAFQATARDG